MGGSAANDGKRLALVWTALAIKAPFRTAGDTSSDCVMFSGDEPLDVADLIALAISKAVAGREVED